jgi:hypothetical protein
VTLLGFCEVCGRKADIHHIIHKSEGGMDISINYKFLCPEHHRGRFGPHKNKNVDLEYKLELQYKLRYIFSKEYYTLDEIICVLGLNKCKGKKFVCGFKLYKEGYKKEDITFKLLGSTEYNEFMLQEYNDFEVANI